MAVSRFLYPMPAAVSTVTAPVTTDIAIVAEPFMLSIFRRFSTGFSTAQGLDQKRWLCVRFFVP